MSGLLDSFGLSVAVSGLVILLAGLFLTPMRPVVLRALRVRLGGVRKRSARTTEITAPLIAATAAPSAPAPTPKIALSPAEQRAADYHEHEALFARTLLTAQKTAEDLVRDAQAEAQEIVARAEAAAAETARASRKNAAEIVQRAQVDADTIVASAKQKAAAWLALLQAEADKLAVEAHQAFQGAQRTVEQNVASLGARFERRMAEFDADPWDQQRGAAALDGADAPRNGSAALR